VALREELGRQGNWFFRWRSYLPLIILPLLLIALRKADWLERAVGDPLQNCWEVFCLSISFVGLAVRFVTVGYVPSGTSGRNTKGQKAKVLNTTGMYSIVRHPLYLGNLVITLGLVLFVASWWLGLIVALAFCLYYERIMVAEETFLQNKYGALFSDWAEKTPTLLPRFKNWQPPNLPFSIRNALKREYSGFFLIIASFTFLDISEDILSGHEWESNWGWITLFIAGLLIYLALRTLKKKTGILDAEGR
jgi:protein-S-isoprenylcysteine O-methyltransferase Ste14